MGSNYQHYQVEDFVADPDFQRWVQHPEPVSDLVWQQWIAANPDKSILVEEAREIILQLRTKTFPIFEDKLSKELTQLNQRLDKWEAAHKQSTPSRKLSSYTQWWVAAAIALLIISGAVFYVGFWSRPVTLATHYGQTRSFWLPDSSLVQLNANSKIRYNRYWRQGQTREVWLEGEAFFTVKPKTVSQKKIKFIVHTQDLDVRVLGTKFNVYNRGKQTRVLLSSGKVALSLAQSENATNKVTKVNFKEEITMQPGEYVVYSQTDRKLVRKNVNPEEHSSWRKGQLKFNFTPLSEIARIIEETYGYQVIIKDSLIQNKKISGTLPANNIDILLKALQEGFDLKSHKQGTTITLN